MGALRGCALSCLLMQRSLGPCRGSLLDVSPPVPQAPLGLGCAWLGAGPPGAGKPPSEGKSSCSGISLLPHEVICSQAKRASCSR